ncbi:MAG: hypothetical protein ACR2Q4_04335 [Geminicoccaceae bacterium]
MPDNTAWTQIDDDMWRHSNGARCQRYHCSIGSGWVLYCSDGSPAAGSSERRLTFPDAASCLAAYDDVNDGLLNTHGRSTASSAPDVRSMVRLA